MTVSVAAFEVAEPTLLVAMQRKRSPLYAVVTLAMDSVAVVTPDKLPPLVIFCHVMPPSIDACHCSVGAGLPEVATVNVTVELVGTDRLAGCVVKDGAVAAAVTVSVAVFEVAVPALLVATQRKRYPLYPLGTEGIVSVLVVTPEKMALLDKICQVLPPLVDTCHCSVGVGLPVTATVNVADAPTAAVRLAGCVVKDGAVPAAVIVNVNGAPSSPALFLANTAIKNDPALLGVPVIMPLVDRVNPRLAKDV